MMTGSYGMTMLAGNEDMRSIDHVTAANRRAAISNTMKLAATTRQVTACHFSSRATFRRR